MISLEPIDRKTFVYDTPEELTLGMINLIKVFKDNPKLKPIFVASYTTDQYVLDVLVFSNSIDKNKLWIKEKWFSMN